MEIKIIIYILIAIVWIVVSLYKRLQKLNQQNNVDTKVVNSKKEEFTKPDDSHKEINKIPSLEDMLKEIWNENSNESSKSLEEVFQNEHRTNYENIEDKKPVNFDENINNYENESYETIEREQKKESDQDKIKKNQSLNPVKRINKKGFNLKDALIYSEIMKRPEY